MRAEIQAYLDGELRLEALPEELRDTALGWENLLAELDDDAGPMMAPGSIEASVMAEIVPVELGDRSITPGAHPIGDEVGSSAGESGSLRTESTMEAVDDARSAKPWILRPRNVRVTPLTGLLAAAAIAAIVIAPWRSGPTPEVAAEPTLYVQFVLEAPAARTVAVAGDFNEWGDGQPLVDPDGDGATERAADLLRGGLRREVPVHGRATQ